MKFTRRQILKYGLAGGAGLMLPWRLMPKAQAAALIPKLSDPAAQPKFVNPVPNALDPGFKYTPAANGEFTVEVGPTTQMTGLVSKGGTPVPTPLWGYGQGGVYTWPGKTFEVQSGAPDTVVNWENNLFGITEHLLPLDKSLHWCYSLPGYKQYTIANAGVPIITHLHGGHSDFQFDGNPEFFYTPGGAIVGPQWANVTGGFTNRFVYDNNVPAGNLWYHDHALGMTRLNVYAGMAGFYFVRDALDTGLPGNPLGLPAWPYENALAIQDRMFKKGGELFYPALPNDPFWADFITGEGLKNGDVPKPSALAEFFGDHMVVNGLIWPKADVEPRNYRLHLLNGTDSRFMVIRFRAVPAGAADLTGAGAPIPFWVIGSDQGLAAAATQTDTLLFEPGGRYDIVFDFKGLQGMRIIMENNGGDAPFGGPLLPGDPDPADLFPNRQTDRIMAFDVADVPDVADAFDPAVIGQYGGNDNTVINTRKVALFEGNDKFGRLQPLLGTAVPTLDAAGNIVNGAIAWHSPTTERPFNAPNGAEIWEIYNATGDAHPVHLHLVNFEILEREGFTADVVEQPLEQHNGTFGVGFRLENIVLDGNIVPAAGVEKAPKDMVTALPGEVTRIKVTFDKSGRYVWHCHILSHEDHEMMRVLEVL
jgi:FtsP/CotA-like multicopper oxidase with cupredoxin domain